MALERELKTYAARKQGLLAAHEGAWCVVHDDLVIGPFWSRDAALTAGYGSFGVTPMLVKQILAVEPVVYFSRPVCGPPPTQEGHEMSESERPKNLPEWSACSPVPYMTLGSEPDGTVTVEGGAFDAGDVQAFTLNGVRFVRALRWTKERPTVPGFYWVRAQGKQMRCVSYVRLYGGKLVVDTSASYAVWLERVDDREWAGPIPAPLEPESPTDSAGR